MANDRYRIADLAIFKGRRDGQYPAEPALAVIEILSPLDSLAKALIRLKDYQAWGVVYLWLIDSENQVIHRFDGRRLHPVDAIEFTDPLFRIDGAELFAAINS